MTVKKALELLVVEDDRNTRHLFRDLAEALGWRVRMAEDGQIGWECYCDSTPDLIISDIMMPGLDGLELLKKVRSKDLNTPFIVVTAARGERPPIQAIKSGANDFILKPLRTIRDLRVLLNRQEAQIVDRKTKEVIPEFIEEQDISFRIPNNLKLIAPLCDTITAHITNADIRFAIKLGLVELVTNAIEHGNLEINMEEKRRALEQTGAVWRQLLEERQSNPLYANRKVSIRSRKNKVMSEWIIQDEGKGFPHEQFIDSYESPDVNGLSGRGIYVARQLFDDLEYLENGSVVRVRKRNI